MKKLLICLFIATIVTTAQAQSYFDDSENERARQEAQWRQEEMENRMRELEAEQRWQEKLQRQREQAEWLESQQRQHRSGSRSYDFQNPSNDGYFN